MYRIQTKYLNEDGTSMGPWEYLFITAEFKTEREAVHAAEGLFHNQLRYKQVPERLDSTPRPYRVVKVVWESTGLPKGENYDTSRKEDQSSKESPRPRRMGKGKARRKA